MVVASLVLAEHERNVRWRDALKALLDEAKRAQADLGDECSGRSFDFSFLVAGLEKAWSGAANLACFSEGRADQREIICWR